jgi:endonuclease/exonuclease/phosphatase family metal-dependent hydrolase
MAELGNTLRVLSANLWNGRADAQAFADLVVEMEADVVAVQELSPEQAEALASVMPHGELQPGREHEGMGIAMKRPGTMSRIPMACRDARVTHLEPADWPGLSAQIEIVNIHIQAPHTLRPNPAFIVRPKQVRGLERHILERPDVQRVVVGDFNATPLWPAYRRIASHLTDAASHVAEQAGVRASRTWGFRPGSARLARNDHGFVGGLEVESFSVVEIREGDHSAIVLDVAT